MSVEPNQMMRNSQVLFLTVAAVGTAISDYLYWQC